MLVRKNHEIRKKTLLIVRLDAIGDYILFRNFIGLISNSKKYKGYAITLVGNSVWKDIAEEYDGKYIEEFIWIDRKKYRSNIIYRLNKLNEIASRAYEVVINASHSREIFYSDSLIKNVHSNEKIGSKGDATNIRKWQKRISDGYYTKLATASNDVLFELCRNKEMFEQILDQEITEITTSISIKNNHCNLSLPREYVAIHIGASTKFRKWPIEKYAKLANYILKNYNLDIVLCGGAKEIEEASRLEKLVEREVCNLVNKTSLSDLLHVLKGSILLVSNDTCAPHLAVALGAVNIITIYNGLHYGRFVPYPRKMTEKYHVVYHPLIARDKERYRNASNSFREKRKLNIDQIEEEAVIRMTVNILEEILGKDRTIQCKN